MKPTILVCTTIVIITTATIIATRLSTETLTLLLGILLGAFFMLPVTLLIAAARAHNSDHRPTQNQPPTQNPPAIILISAGGSPQGPYAPSSQNWRALESERYQKQP